jgi:hypothetical protein
MPRRADEPSGQVRLITEIVRVIVPAKADPTHQPDAVCDISRQVVEPGVIRSAMPAEPDPVSLARSQLDKMRGINRWDGLPIPRRAHERGAAGF